jgi:Tfp pilus assembly protein PilN
MNAVNLIPADSRQRRNLSASRPTLALIGGLLVALIAAVLYVSAVNQVTTRQSELTRVTASAAEWSAAANSYASYVLAAQQRTQQLTDVRQLASGRFPWSQLLSQIGGLMPAAAALITLQATTTPSTTSGPPLPAVQLTGCAASQSAVAKTMVQLHKVAGVSAVTLSSSTDSGTSAAAPAGASGSGACPFPVQFQVALTFGTPAAATASGAPATAPATASSSAAAPSTTTTPTGAVQ